MAAAALYRLQGSETLIEFSLLFLSLRCYLLPTPMQSGRKYAVVLVPGDNPDLLFTLPRAAELGGCVWIQLFAFFT